MEKIKAIIEKVPQEMNENNASENFYGYGEERKEIEERHKKLQAQIAKNLFEIRQLAEQNSWLIALCGV